MRTLQRFFCVLALVLMGSRLATAGEVHTVRNGDRQVEVFWQPATNPVGTLLMFSGGAGGFGRVSDGKPHSSNFLVRTLDLWTAKGFNVAYFGDLNADRHSSEHMADIQAALRWIEETSPLPVYLVGTSRGTISAAYAALNIPDEHVHGLVLTSTMEELVALPGLAALTLTVLDLSHKNDSCWVTSPAAGRAIIGALKKSPRAAFVEVSGGASYGNPCKPMAHHGFNGIEAEVVDKVTEWLVQP